MGQLRKRMICSTNKKTRGFLIGPSKTCFNPIGSKTKGFPNSMFWKLQVFEYSRFLKTLGISILQVSQKFKIFQNSTFFKLQVSKLQVFQNKTKVESDKLGHHLKSPIFILHRAEAPKNGVKFHQKTIGAIRCSVATSYDDARKSRDVSPPFEQSEVYTVIDLTEPINYSR